MCTGPFDVVRRVKEHKVKNRIASAIVSMSLAGPWSASLNDAIDAASSAGITVVTAAGIDSAVLVQAAAGAYSNVHVP